MESGIEGRSVVVWGVGGGGGWGLFYEPGVYGDVIGGASFPPLLGS